MIGPLQSHSTSVLSFRFWSWIGKGKKWYFWNSPEAQLARRGGCGFGNHDQEDHFVNSTISLELKKKDPLVYLSRESGRSTSRSGLAVHKVGQSPAHLRTDVFKKKMLLAVGSFIDGENSQNVIKKKQPHMTSSLFVRDRCLRQLNFEHLSVTREGYGAVEWYAWHIQWLCMFSTSKKQFLHLKN